jgi:hypothetical protein
MLADYETEVTLLETAATRRLLIDLCHRKQAFRIDRFGQVFDRRAAEMTDMRFDARMPCNQNYFAQRASPDFVEQLEPIAVREHQIEQQHLVRTVIECGPGLGERIGRHYLVTMQLQYFSGSGNEVCLVID